MPTQDVLSGVVKVTSRVLGLEPDTISPDANFVFDLGAESVQSLQLVAGFEEEFGVDLDQEAALAVQTVEGAVRFIQEHLDRAKRA
jgi:acyl carrier protein